MTGGSRAALRPTPRAALRPTPRPALRPTPRPRASSRAGAGRTAGRGAAALVVLALVAGCGGTSPGPTGTPLASGSPGGSGAASGDRGPRPTAWPGNAVLGIEALGAADVEIRKGINDFSAGVAAEDLALMRRAADGLAGVDVLLPNTDRIEIFPPMRPLAARLRDVLPEISEASRRLRAAIDAGDGPGISTASGELAEALTGYAEVQPELAGWVIESVEQRRLLLR